MAGRVFQRCVRDVPSLRLNQIQVATKITNPLKKGKKAKVETTFTQQGEKLTLRSQTKKRTPEEDVEYRRSEIVANMVSGSCFVFFDVYLLFTLYSNHSTCPSGGLRRMHG